MAYSRGDLLISSLHNNRPLHDPVTWYKITYTGEQVAQWDFQNNTPAFVLGVPLRNLLTSLCNFVPCDQVVQRAYCFQLRHDTISLITVFEAILTGRQSGKKLQCFYGKPIPNNHFQN